jgi:hypothetical protein
MSDEVVDVAKMADAILMQAARDGRTTYETLAGCVAAACILGKSKEGIKSLVDHLWEPTRAVASNYVKDEP